MTSGWDQSLATGIQIIDEQHKEYFVRVGRLLNLSLEGSRPEDCLEIFDFMSRYVVLHFGTEEELMDRYAFTHQGTHKAQHAWFRDELVKLRTNLERQPGGSRVALTSLLVDWFRNHISRVDQKLSEFLKAKGVA